MQQEAIIKSVQWASNMKGGEVFQEEHVWVLLGILRASDHRKISASTGRSALQVDADEFDFVPQVLLAVLHSHYKESNELHRVLRLDWVRTWAGWKEAATELQKATDTVSYTHLTLPTKA